MTAIPSDYLKLISSSLLVPIKPGKQYKIGRNDSPPTTKLDKTYVHEVDIAHFLRTGLKCTCGHHEWQHTYTGRCLADFNGDEEYKKADSKNQQGRKLCDCSEFTPHQD